MKILDLNPKRVFYYFGEICKIPHGSGNTKQISQYVQDFAKEHSLEFFSDSLYNVVIKKAAAKGYENHPAVVLQCHLDMVCEKTDESDMDFEVDPIRVKTDGEYVFAESTTLGADNGIAAAMVLAILEDDTLLHPELQAVFTTDEETGMYGAMALDTSLITAKRFINIDSEQEGVLVAGCAGGATAECNFSFDYCDIDTNCFQILVSGLKGGHSGVDINKDLLSANKVLADVLKGINTQYNLIEFTGGEKDNAITRSAKAIIACKDDITEYINSIKTRYSTTLDTAVVSVKPIFGEFKGLTFADTKKAVDFLCSTPYGVVSKIPEFKDIVETSLNMGRVRITKEGATVVFSLRSSVKSKLEQLKQTITHFTERLSGSVTINSEYPAWEYNKDSKLRKIMCDTFYDIYNKPLKIEVIHAGLECGLFSEKIKNLDAVSIGPDIYAVHSPDEKLSVKSTERTYEYILAALKNL